MKLKKGDKVYIVELEQFGIVEAVLPNGVAKSVKVKTPDGTKIVDTLELTLKIVKLMMSFMPILDDIINHVKSWFK